MNEYEVEIRASVKLLSVSLTAPQWNVLEVALDRYIDDQVDDISSESVHLARKAGVVKILLRHELAKAGAG